jgi:hypothetical protein
MLEQAHEKLHNLFFANGPFEDLEIEVPARHPRSYGDRLPVKVVLQHGCPPARRPRSASVRPLTHSTLVDEDDRAPFLAG